MKLGTDTITTTKAHANIDALYGPYSDRNEALYKVPKNLRKKGLTVGIIENEEVIEYQWKKGIEDSDLENKIEKVDLIISPIGDTTISKDEGENVVILFLISGRSNIQKGLLYLVVGSSEIYIGEFTSLGKGSNSIEITNIHNSGIFYYRIKVLDSSGTYATTEDKKEYIEYEIRYGGISTTYNFAKLNTILIKNIYSVAGLYFTCNITIRDDTFSVSELLLSDGENINISLTPCDSTGIPTGTYLGNNYYYLPNSTELSPLNGKTCYIILKYYENGIQYSKTTTLFTLLSVDSLELIPESTSETFYIGLPSFFSFLLLSGVENISATLSKHPDSDFDFETVTVATYKRFSLKVIPNKIKNNAEIKLNYSFYYNNVEYTGTFTFAIGNILDIPEQKYYEPPSGTISRDDLIYADENDYDVIEDGQYYKIIESPVTKNYNSCAFLVDTYCKINKIDDKSIKYLTITYGNEEIGYITEEEINCRGNVTDTPLNEWVQIGLGYNLQESVERNNRTITASYFSIYINGMIVKNVLIDGINVHGLVYNPQSQLVITFNNGIYILKCLVYYKNNGTENIIPNTDSGTSIIYNNYLSHNTSFVEPSNLPELKLMKIIDSEENEKYFRLINAYNEEVGSNLMKHTTIFGTIGSEKASSMAVYDPAYSSSTIESTASLFRLSVDIKKPALKEYAVLCRGQYIVDGANLLEGIIVEVHTLGTSTLVYSVPNFKFTFWRLVGDTIEHYYPTFIKKNDDEYYHEFIYTAKCDYMDSSHLNNTPTCNYYNNLILKLIGGGDIDGSPSALIGGIDAIMGFPIIMEVSDSADNFEGYFTNIGSFMLNVDKTGESLGFEVDLNNEHLSCISFEGTSNDNEHGAAGRFILNDSRLHYFDNDAAIDEAYNQVSAAINNKLIDEPGDLDPIGDLNGYPYAQWCQFISDGLEYRYPDSDIIKSKNGKLSKVMKLKDFKKLYSMWSWVSKSDTYDQSTYKSQFVQHFNLEYCMLYFIQLMIFGQTDNLGKNAMFDCWDGEHWYPRPYDLDSQSGLDNNGNDNIATFVEIKPEFSLNWNSSYTEEEKRENYLLEDSEVPYGSHTYDRYHYSSNNSKLWINFYKNFKSEIEAFYALLRRKKDSFGELLYDYSADSIIELCENLLIKVLGISQYNQDFRNKYLANSDQRLAYGNRWDKFKKWIKLRFAFCDSYFGAPEEAIYSATSAFTYNIKVDSPQYIILQYLTSKTTKFVINLTTFSAGSSAATKTTLKVNQGSVLETSLFKYVSKDSGPNKFTGLISLDVSGNNHITGIEGLVGRSLPNVKTINISNSTVNSITIPAQTKKLVAENVSLSSLIFADNCLIEEIDLKGSTLNGDVSFSNLPNLKKLDLSNCKIKANIILANIENIETFLTTDASFEGDFTISDGVNIDSFNFTGLSLHNISFSGSNLLIHTLNFHNTIFGLSSINLNTISRNIRNLYFDGCQTLSHIELTEGNKFDSLEVFSIANSSIASIGTNNTQFDASVFNNIASLSKVSSYRSDGTVTTTPFDFQNTNIVKIVNLTWNGSGNSLFSNCTKLTSIGGTLNLTTNINSIFYRCFVLETLPTINVANSVTSATYAFVMNNALGYNNISAIIKKCTNVTNFSNACQCTKFADNLVINLSDLFAGNTSVTTLNFMFTPNSWGNSSLTSTSNKFIINGTIPASVTSSAYMFTSVSTLSIPFNIFSSATHIIDISGMFSGATITFTGSNLPTYNDDYDVSITLTNTVNASFFPRSVENMMGLFYNTNVQIITGDVFNNLTNLKNCCSVFGSSSPRKFSITDSTGTVVDLNVNVINLWLNNSNLTTIAGCFANVYNVFCTGLNFHENIISTNTIDISGLFGLSNPAYRNYHQISINIDSIVPEIKTDNYYSIPGNTTNYYGVFQNRSIYILNNTESVLSKLSSNCKNLFLGATIYVSSTVKTFDLSGVRDATGIFYGTNLYKYNSDSSHTYVDTDRYFVNIIMPSACSVYADAFRDSCMLQTLPSIRSSSASNFSYAFSASYINLNEVKIPYDYFVICKANLLNVNHMFYNNQYITELLYNESVGLFLDCIQLTNINDMFNSCHFLHKGIPVNLFGSNPIPYLTTLTNLFRETCIFYDIENDSYKWVDISTFAPLTGLTSIEGMFSRSRPYNLISGYGTLNNLVKNGDEKVYVIAPNTFTNKIISNIRSLFTYSGLNIPFEFAGFEYGTEAFFDSNIEEINANFVFDLNISIIRDVNRMFYDITSTPTKSVNNLGVFVDKISAYSNIQKANIAGNLTNTDIDDSLKGRSADADSRYYNGFNLSGRIIYNN